MKRTLYIPLLIAVALFASCKSGKYAATEKVYKKKATEYADLYKEAPVESQLAKINSINYKGEKHPFSDANILCSKKWWIPGRTCLSCPFDL
mgnify:CR=1 FL=1